ncbi:disease resistance protein [Pyrus ussuriensis x Pyrus communis]|uniref:Disease resistance protein n=1 Tax=Pyrus ussuriensis x Pyrus communis TaxID=2448454 RepID=A0A5N5FKD0_9ROSA|nr:disease resistance protein [Pyrus ussuriensis x Pyrus communis]
MALGPVHESHHLHWISVAKPLSQRVHGSTTREVHQHPKVPDPWWIIQDSPIFRNTRDLLAGKCSECRGGQLERERNDSESGLYFFYY